MGSSARTPLELWAGPECTVNRTRDGYSDQIELTGHDGRPADLDRFAALGVRALRYPVLWERTAPDGIGSADWSWPDERLARLRELMPEAPFLRPGIGTQGGRVEHLAAAFAPGRAGGLVSASRSIAHAHETNATHPCSPAAAARAEAERLRTAAWGLA